MKNKSTILFLVLTFLGYFQIKASSLDSLKKLLKTEKGKERAQILSLICKEYVFSNKDSAIKYGTKGIMFSKENGFKLCQADILTDLGNIYLQSGEYEKSLDNYIEAEKIHEKENAPTQLKVATIINIGIVYELQNIFDKALEQYELALKMAKGIDDSDLEAQALGHLGSLYYSKNDKTKALNYFSESLKMNQITKNIPRIMESLNNVGIVYQELGRYTEALENFTIDLEYAKNGGIKTDVIAILHNIALVYKDQKDFTHAIAYIDSSIAIGKQIKEFEKLQEVYLTLSEIYKEQNNIEKAFEYFQLSAAAKDSLINQTRDKQFIEMSTKYDTEKKETENKLLKTEGEKQRAISLSIAIGLILVAALAYFIFRGYRVSQKANVLLGKQNTEIKEQKNIIEEKHKEITDSINYAERIQRSFLASKELLDENLKDYFVFFKPKDVVSGDFYWASKVNNSIETESFLLATADSTGHGVPGAIMSLLNITSLENAIRLNSNPAEILNQTRKTIIERLKKDGSAEGGKDGMDCSLISFDFKNKTLQIANANNPVWIVRTKADLSTSSASNANVASRASATNVEIIEIKPDKMPVGKHDKDKEPFVQKTFMYQTGDVMFALTDGFPDQFGGEHGKKFMSKNLKDFLSTNTHFPMYKQKELLEAKFKNWVGELDQVDDVTIIGVRL